VGVVGWLTSPKEHNRREEHTTPTGRRPETKQNTQEQKRGRIGGKEPTTAGKTQPEKKPAANPTVLQQR